MSKGDHFCLLLVSDLFPLPSVIDSLPPLLAPMKGPRHVGWSHCSSGNAHDDQTSTGSVCSPGMVNQEVRVFFGSHYCTPKQVACGRCLAHASSGRGPFAVYYVRISFIKKICRSLLCLGERGPCLSVMDRKGMMRDDLMPCNLSLGLSLGGARDAPLSAAARPRARQALQCARKQPPAPQLAT